MENRYEVIDYKETNYRFSCGWGRYVTPHLHREFEIGIVLSNGIRIKSGRDQDMIGTGEMWLMNPFENHEMCVQPQGAVNDFVQLQVSPVFFRGYYPDIEGIRFQTHHLKEEEIGKEAFSKIRSRLIEAAEIYYRHEPGYQLECAARINLLFHDLIRYAPHRRMDGNEQTAAQRRQYRIRSISTFIEKNYDHKLLLGELAQREGLSLNYLSAFFSENFGMSFQEYLLSLRCTKARELLMTTDLKLLDISMMCGFSDPKYLRRGIRKLYGTDTASLRKEKELELRTEEGEEVRESERTLSGKTAQLFMDHAVRFLQQEGMNGFAVKSAVLP